MDTELAPTIATIFVLVHVILFEAFVANQSSIRKATFFILLFLYSGCAKNRISTKKVRTLEHDSAINQFELASRAISESDIHSLKVYLLENPRLVSKKKAKTGWTLLHDASFRCNVDVAGILLAKGSDIDAKMVTGHSPLTLSYFSKCWSVTMFLLEAGANYCHKNADGYTFEDFVKMDKSRAFYNKLTHLGKCNDRIDFQGRYTH